MHLFDIIFSTEFRLFSHSVFTLLKSSPVRGLYVLYAGVPSYTLHKMSLLRLFPSFLIPCENCIKLYQYCTIRIQEPHRGYQVLCPAFQTHQATLPL